MSCHAPLRRPRLEFKMSLSVDRAIKITLGNMVQSDPVAAISTNHHYSNKYLYVVLESDVEPHAADNVVAANKYTKVRMRSK